MLRDSVYPSQRESAVLHLAELDWHKNANVADDLVKAAKDDPAARIRACCIVSLVKMEVKSKKAIEAFKTLMWIRDLFVLSALTL